jgi:MSHA biogenesis protein MshJ
VKARLRRWWAQRAPRERWLAIAVAVIAVAAGIESSLLAPRRVESTRLARELELNRARLQQMQALAAQQASAGESEVRQKRATLQERRANAVRTIVEANVDLIAPQEMTRQLEAILVRHPTLRFIGMNSSGPKPLVENASGTKSAAAGVYQHGLEVQIEGPYLDLLGYLDALERAPYRLYWRELDLRVGTTGVPVTRLVFFTLSKEAAWLRL